VFTTVLDIVIIWLLVTTLFTWINWKIHEHD